MQLSNRLVSLDILRGLTIAGMIVVNDPGSWTYVYPPLRHASWHGITPTDFVFPFFLFIVGISIVLAYTKRLQVVESDGPLILKAWIRTLMIFGMGLFLAVGAQSLGFKILHLLLGVILLYGLSEIQVPTISNQRRWQLGAGMFILVTLFLVLHPDFTLASFRWPGVLQRIAIVFLICVYLFLKCGWKTQAIIGVILLMGYWLAMILIPVPLDEVGRDALASGEVLRASGLVSVSGLQALSDNYLAGNLEPGVNLQAWLDRMLVPGRIYEKTWDPEGILSTLPAIGTGITGMMAGHIVLRSVDKQQTAIHLFVYGFCMLVIGNVWDWFFPFNKNLWSSSYVMYTSGLSTLTFAAIFWYVDLKGLGENNRLFTMGKVFGANAISAYVLHSLFARLSFPVRDGFMDLALEWGIQGEFASLSWALLYTMFIFSLALILYKRGLYIRL